MAVVVPTMAGAVVLPPALVVPFSARLATLALMVPSELLRLVEVPTLASTLTTKLSSM